MVLGFRGLAVFPLGEVSTVGCPLKAEDPRKARRARQPNTGLRMTEQGPFWCVQGPRKGAAPPQPP